MMRQIVLLVPGLFLLPACSRQMPAVTDQQARVIEGARTEQVLVIATRVLQREFGRVHVNREALTIDTEPAEFATDRESGTTRDLYHGQSTMRRVGHLSLAPQAQNTVVRLRIDLERRDTERMANVPLPRENLGNLPNYTPIERDAATTERQNAVWTFVRRDRKLERSLLDELVDELTPPAARPAAAEAPEAAQP